MLKTQSIKYSYGNNQTFDFPDIQCDAGSKLLILGKSGIGKSTLLHILGGLIKPKGGNVFVDDQNLNTLSGAQLDKFRGANIGIIFQRNHFVRSLNVLENLLLTQKFSGEKQDRNEALHILDKLDLGHKMYQKTEDLSEGEKQRVTIARSVINKPKLILADEPSSALDDYNCEKVISLLEEQAKAINAALVVVTHDARLKDIIPNQIVLS